jgi:RHS repeat-associated protein
VKNEAGALTTSTYDAANQLVTSVAAAGTTTFTFDAAGNQQIDQAPSGTTTRAWDYENQETIVVLPSVARVTMSYTADFRRAREGDLVMVAVNYLWNPINDNIVREFDDAGATVGEYTTEPDLYGNVVSQYRNGQTSYLHFDGQGNSTELTNEAGEVTDIIRYSAFGEVTERSGTTELPFQSCGQKGYYWDEETGEYSVRERPLLTSLGRWLSSDRIAFDENISHAYLYSRNAPLDYYDPSGLQEEVSCGKPWTCCCCVDKLTIPKSSIMDIDELVIELPELPGRRKRPPRRSPFWGVEFHVEIEAHWNLYGAEPEKDCCLEWWEHLAKAAPPQKDNKWYDQYDPKLLMFKDWRKSESSTENALWITMPRKRYAYENRRQARVVYWRPIPNRFASDSLLLRSAVQRTAVVRTTVLLYLRRHNLGWIAVSVFFHEN